MVSKPSLLILDEPTSGLDSSKAARVLKVLRKLAKEGHSIIFTIHQPSFLLYSLLSRVIVLNAGETIYQGNADQVAPYLQSLGITLSKTSTICDFFML
jgi:ATP-binding cassette subfamily G (WHITE) protein 2